MGILDGIQLVGWEWILFIGLLLMFVITGGIVAGVMMYRWKWNFRWIVFENIPPFGYIPSRRGRCRLIKFGDGGEEVYYLKGLKVVRSNYGERIGTRQVAWAIGKDGLWYATKFGNFDDKLREIGIVPVHTDARLANSSLRKGLEKKYDDRSFLEKHAAMVMFGLFIIVLLIFAGLLWFTFDQTIKVISANAGVIEGLKEVVGLLKETLSGVDNIRSGGSGFTT